MPKKIALNVLEGITRKANIQRALEAGEVALVVFTGSRVKVKEKIEELKRLDTIFSLAFSFMAGKILDMDYIVKELKPIDVYKEEDVFDLESILKKYPYIIGPNITVNSLAKVALGVIDSFIPALIWTYLYKGRRVYLDFESCKNYMDAPMRKQAMEELVDGYISALKSMGAIEIKIGEYVSIIKDEGEIEEEAKKPSYSGKKIITAKDLEDLPEGRYILPRGSIVTPLARDKARLMGIVFEIDKQGE